MKKSEGRCHPQKHGSVLGSSGGTCGPFHAPEMVVQTIALPLSWALQFPSIRV